MPAKALYQATYFLLVYISIAAATATNGFALTASHLEEPQVTKGSCPTTRCLACVRPAWFNGAPRSKANRGGLTADLVEVGAQSPVGASLLAKDVNDNAYCLDARVVWTFFASRLAPTVECVHPRNQVGCQAASLCFGF